MDLAVMVHESEDAAPTLLLSHELSRRGALVATKTPAGAGLAVENRGAILRVVPHPDLDACGFQGKHAAYSITWAIPTLCHAAPPLVLPATREEAARVWRRCLTCGEAWGTKLSPSSQPHLTWWDVTEPVTVRAEEIPPATRAERAVADPLPDPEPIASDPGDDTAELAEQRRNHLLRVAAWTDMSPHIYDWPELAERLVALGDRPEVTWSQMTAEQRVSLVGVRRHLLLSELAATETSLRRLMYEASVLQDTGPVRLSELSGVSRRTVPGWVTEGGNRRSSAITDAPPY
ncbi:hypothetical protein [Streptomyces mexicanus]|uniref:Uncharacterized protein n=1 Tax=Streptomyces mexicanus TaxID=178566 RepID=A0A7X1LU55_9ACTN|nr:hypothetical protein [Streptomyces mexicanus]MBC2869873.1 hypothetical protein [Streptomyces mexicanus]